MIRRLFLLHGFLGRPGDWDLVLSHLDHNAAEIFVPDLYADKKGLQLYITDWAIRFNEQYALTCED
ncbi:MAG: hypothetical protein N2578_09985, partial [Bdellovibrionaceae bacterium]|nr:hypothetical protein [Pseudobdellovibrionaceae bacterium]